MESGLNFEAITFDRLNKTIAEFRNEHKPTYNNYYGVSNDTKCECFCSNGTLLLRVKEYDYYRLYILSNNRDALIAILKSLDKGVYVLNLPSKSPIDEWDKILADADFKPYASYERYYNTQIKGKKISIGEEAEENDTTSIYKLFTQNFDKKTDHIPSFEQIREMIINKQIYITRGEQNEVVGFIIFTLEGKKCYLNAWLELSGRGIFLLYKFFNLMIDRGLSYCYFWVNSKNVSVKNIHTALGAKKDGLVDYTYIN
jgi:hypothetical protein